MSRSFGCRSFTTRPPIEISPALIGSSPAIMRSKVDLPQPEGPSRTTKLPSSILRSMPWITSRSPKLFLMLRTVTAAMALALPCTAGTRRQDPVGNLDEPRRRPRAADTKAGSAVMRDAKSRTLATPQPYGKNRNIGSSFGLSPQNTNSRAGGLEVEPERIAHEAPASSTACRTAPNQPLTWIEDTLATAPASWNSATMRSMASGGSGSTSSRKSMARSASR